MTKATSAPQLAPGTVIDGMYTLGESLRSRVGAVTYEATDPNDKKVEVTVYRADSEEEVKKRLQGLGYIS
jgi:hypothetical protein